MMKYLTLILALSAVSCDQGMAARQKTTVTLTSVAFADDCGGTPPHQPPAPARREPPAAAAPMKPSEVAQERVADEAMRRRCEQTSMQLVVDGEAGSELLIKSVEVLDADGKVLGKLSVSKPTRWNDAKAAYEPWDQKVSTVPMSISYVLSQPSFINQWEERDRTYTVKVIAAIGGVDRPLKATVLVVGQPAPVPT
jgi:hypothetical protein